MKPVYLKKHKNVKIEFRFKKCKHLLTLNVLNHTVNISKGYCIAPSKKLTFYKPLLHLTKISLIQLFYLSSHHVLLKNIRIKTSLFKPTHRKANSYQKN